ncbi:hypothetical protein [Flammeovirga agarivorans]|uniref:Uncharacterized protein n=1 Tax=Flammeovirga agarivorans TaxID=2726742 RepID=A0A7X8SN42_9BACT|nr:hypothetical protein [Flammeovirga agarivorans]NLR93268.1 hypothetical protein [Flammeovirga agarivorans]
MKCIKLFFFLFLTILPIFNITAASYYPNGVVTINSYSDWQNVANWINADGGTGYPSDTDKIILSNAKELRLNDDITTHIFGVYLEFEADGRCSILEQGKLFVLDNLLLQNSNVQLEVYGYLEIENNLQLDNGNLLIKNGGELIVNNHFTRSDIGSGQISIEHDESAFRVYGDFTDDHYRPSVTNNPTIDIQGACYTKAGGFCDLNLPVELVSFTADANHKNIYIEWSTAQEINNDFFILQRSIDKRDWFDLSRIKGAGNSNQTHYYEYIDEIKSLNNSVYYRLLQVDFDGSTTVYGPLSTRVNNIEEHLKILSRENSYQVIIQVESDEMIRYCLFSSTGKQTIFREVESNSFIIESKCLFEGINILFVQQGHKIFLKKIM